MPCPLQNRRRVDAQKFLWAYCMLRLRLKQHLQLSPKFLNEPDVLLQLPGNLLQKLWRYRRRQLNKQKGNYLRQKPPQGQAALTFFLYLVWEEFYLVWLYQFLLPASFLVHRLRHNCSVEKWFLLFLHAIWLQANWFPAWQFVSTYRRNFPVQRQWLS